MKMKIKWLIVMIILCSLIISACSKWDDYTKYIDENKIYPQKPDSLKVYVGYERALLEWTIVDPKVTSCKVYYTQEGEQDSILVPIAKLNNFTNDTIQVVIDNLIETTCYFKVISYDDYGHSSLEVETEEYIYGDNYQKSLLNRSLKSKQMLNNQFHLQWYDADETELGIELEYKDIFSKSKKIYIPDTVTSTVIADFNVDYPFAYRTLYLPKSTAIDTFYTAVEEVKFDFPSELSNTKAPFEITNRGLWLNNRAGTISGWIVNDVVEKQGSVDNNWGRRMVMWGWSGFTPVPSITNGKIYQILSLPSGSYSFRATVFKMSSQNNQVYLVVNNGFSLLDITNVENESLAFVDISSTFKGDYNVAICEFTLDAPSTVSLGIVGNVGPNQEVFFHEFELITN